jgi:hypothetical protein
VPTTTGTVGLKRELPELYRTGTEPVLVDVPELPFLMIDGTGDPNTSVAYPAAVRAVYSVAYTLRFALKRGPLALDAVVMPLEGLWWVPDMTLFMADRDAWQWTLMIAEPAHVTEDLVAAARAEATRKKGLAAVDRVRLERYAEGPAAQVLHLGPYRAEGPTVERLHRFIGEQGYALTGKHHEIYLGDPRRTAPERLRTIIRQPVAPAPPPK